MTTPTPTPTRASSPTLELSHERISKENHQTSEGTNSRQGKEPRKLSIQSNPGLIAPKPSPFPKQQLKSKKVAACARCRARKLCCNLFRVDTCARCKRDGTECIQRDGSSSESFLSADLTAAVVSKIDAQPMEATTGFPHDPEFLRRFNLIQAQDLDISLPAFLKSPPQNMAEEDIAHLQEKGALTLPPPMVRNALLSAYFHYVHPYLPLLDVSRFLDIINMSNIRFGQTSLLLYQAVMFAAAAVVDLKVVQEAGYASIKSARQELFQKTKLLYDFDYESDRLAVVQSLLLMSYWQRGLEDNKGMWHWLGIAISLARDIGLSQNFTYSNLPLREQKLRKRIWWCRIMRDRLVALGMRQPTRITEQEIELPLLQIFDFDLDPIQESSTAHISDIVCLPNVKIQQELAALCVAHAQLCVCIGHVLAARYFPVVNDRAFGRNTTESITKLCPRPFHDSSESVISVDTLLLTWEERLPWCCQDQSLTSNVMKNGEESVSFHRTLLHMLYHTAMTALHRPQLLLLDVLESPELLQIKELSQLRVRTSAAHITKMMTELDELCLTQYLPPTGVTIVTLSMVTNLYDMNNPVPRFRSNARNCLHKCMEVLENLRSVYHSADWAAALLNSALRTMNIPTHLIPPQISQNPLFPGYDDEGASGFPQLVDTDFTLPTRSSMDNPLHLWLRNKPEDVYGCSKPPGSSISQKARQLGFGFLLYEENTTANNASRGLMNAKLLE